MESTFALRTESLNCANNIKASWEGVQNDPNLFCDAAAEADLGSFFLDIEGIENGSVMSTEDVTFAWSPDPVPRQQQQWTPMMRCEQQMSINNGWPGWPGMAGDLMHQQQQQQQQAMMMAGMPMMAFGHLLSPSSGISGGEVITDNAGSMSDSSISKHQPHGEQQQGMAMMPSSHAQCHPSPQLLFVGAPHLACSGNSSLNLQQDLSGLHGPARLRQECLRRYLEKKARRNIAGGGNSKKKVRYTLRKINADRRPRVKGRFIKKDALPAFYAARAAAAAAAEGVPPLELAEVDSLSMDADDDCTSMEGEEEEVSN